jgi:hypothetical protein
MTKSAIFSECGKYRYLLSRDWSDGKIAMCIGLNPSNANAEKDDPTIRILIRTLKYLDFGGLRMVNLYAYISPKPSKLFEVADPQGLNDEWLITTAHGCQEIIFCWGQFKNIDYQARKVTEMFPSVKCFGKNKNGTPLHPMAIMWQGLKITQLQNY